MSDTVSGGVRDVGVERSEVTRIPSLCQDSLSLPVIHSVLSPPFINSDSVLAPSAPLVGSRFGRSSFTYSPLTAFGSRKEWSETRRCRGERMIRPGGPRAKIQK